MNPLIVKEFVEFRKSDYMSFDIHKIWQARIEVVLVFIFESISIIVHNKFASSQIYLKLFRYLPKLILMLMFVECWRCWTLCKKLQWMILDLDSIIFVYTQSTMKRITEKFFFVLM